MRFLRDLRQSNSSGVDGVIVAVNHVVRSPAEIYANSQAIAQAKRQVEAHAGAEVLPEEPAIPTAALHYLVFVQVGEETFVDVVDSLREGELQKGDTVHI